MGRVKVFLSRFVWPAVAIPIGAGIVAGGFFLVVVIFLAAYLAFVVTLIGTLTSVVMGVVRVLAAVFHFSLPIPYWPIPVATVLALLYYELVAITRQAILTWRWRQTMYTPERFFLDNQLW